MKWQVAVMFAILVNGCAAQGCFPSWRGSQLALPALWETTPIIAVGDVVNIKTYGIQYVAHLPRPVTQDLHELHWCYGEFQSVAVIKGPARLLKKHYLWASVNPGCKVFFSDPQQDERRTVRVWFLREEGDFLRPTFDGGSPYFIGFVGPWPQTDESPSVILGELLLRPSASAISLDDFANEIWNFAEIACTLLPRPNCIERLRDLTRLGNSALQIAVCRYLRVEQAAKCQM